MHQQNPTPGRFQTSHEHGNCKAELALRMIQGRWKLPVLRKLIDGIRRFSDLQRALVGVSQKVLTVHAQVPPRVDYTLSSLGQELIPVLESLHAFNEQALEYRTSNRARCGRCHHEWRCNRARGSPPRRRQNCPG